MRHRVGRKPDGSLKMAKPQASGESPTDVRHPARSAGGGASREDRLIRHEPAGTLQVDDIKVELPYDYIG